MWRILKDNGLSLAFWGLFVLCAVGQAVSGHRIAVSQPGALARLGPLLDALGGAEFLRGVFGNWQAALLQLFVLIVFAQFLRQRGASHSRKTEDGRPHGGITRPAWAPPPSEERRSWLFRNSLGVAFLALFLLSFAGFFLADRAYHAQRQPGSAAAGGPLPFLASAQWWFDVLQTWQAEFFAMGAFLVLSIYLRQEYSAESKPVEAPDSETGETNE